MLVSINEIVFLVRKTAHVRKLNVALIQRRNIADQKAQKRCRANVANALRMLQLACKIGDGPENASRITAERLFGCADHFDAGAQFITLFAAALIERNHRAVRYGPQEKKHQGHEDGSDGKPCAFRRRKHPGAILVKRADNRTRQKEQRDSRVQK